MNNYFHLSISLSQNKIHSKIQLNKYFKERMNEDLNFIYFIKGTYFKKDLV